MRASQKVALLGSIAKAIDERYGWQDAFIYLRQCGAIVRDRDEDGYSDKEFLVKEELESFSDESLVAIAEDLELPLPSIRRESLVPPRNWPNNGKFRLFISHLSKDKDKAKRLRDCLVPYNISGFVAHEDIMPTVEWQKEIERALNAMDAFVAMHTVDFSKSFWSQQEVGFAVARAVKIISLKMPEDPTGFISKQQALPRLRRTAEEIAKEIYGLLKDDSATKDRLAQIEKLNKPKADPDEIPF